MTMTKTMIVIAYTEDAAREYAVGKWFVTKVMSIRKLGKDEDSKFFKAIPNTFRFEVTYKTPRRGPK